MSFSLYSPSDLWRCFASENTIELCQWCRQKMSHEKRFPVCLLLTPMRLPRLRISVIVYNTSITWNSPQSSPHHPSVFSLTWAALPQNATTSASLVFELLVWKPGQRVGFWANFETKDGNGACCLPHGKSDAWVTAGELLYVSALTIPFLVK